MSKWHPDNRTSRMNELIAAEKIGEWQRLEGCDPARVLSSWPQLRPRWMNPSLTDQSFKEEHHPRGMHCGIHQNTCLEISVLRSLGEVRRRHEQPPLVRNDA